MLLLAGGVFLLSRSPVLGSAAGARESGGARQDPAGRAAEPAPDAADG
jgi:hypothetical protein